ncbi:MAG: GNAT family N-acetyltransferase [Holosporaceae bacterium]|jgi:GNAT superfamily N-acetyltransferase|nr:GNAT family N-acetyltransferase [Holosporaceae bacterium]
MAPKFLLIFVTVLLSGCVMEERHKYDVQIKEVTPHELSEVFPLFVQLNPSAKEATFMKNYNKAKKNEYNLYKAVITETGKLHTVGLMGYLFNEDLCVGRTMYIDILVVDKHYRNKGIGKQLMKFAISKLHQDKCARFLRWTTRNNLAEAISFYKNAIASPIGYYYRIDNPNFNE